MRGGWTEYVGVIAVQDILEESAALDRSVQYLPCKRSVDWRFLRDGGATRDRLELVPFTNAGRGC